MRRGAISCAKEIHGAQVSGTAARQELVIQGSSQVKLAGGGGGGGRENSYPWTIFQFRNNCLMQNATYGANT